MYTIKGRITIELSNIERKILIMLLEERIKEKDYLSISKKSCMYELLRKLKENEKEN